MVTSDLLPVCIIILVVASVVMYLSRRDKRKQSDLHLLRGKSREEE